MSEIALENFQIKRTPTISVRPYAENLFDDLLDFCRRESEENTPASKNMWAVNWHSEHATLPFLLTYTDRFRPPTGQLFLLYDGEAIVGCSGVYLSEFSTRVAIAGVRTWISQKYRNQQLVKNYLLVAHRSWAKSQGCDTIAITFNAYNRNLVKLFTTGMKRGRRTQHHMFSENFNILPYPAIIQNTAQTIVYENLSSRHFDWNQLRTPE